MLELDDIKECIQESKIVMPEIEEVRNELYHTQKQNEELKMNNKMLSQRISDLHEQLNMIRYILKR